jgi:hypothetical protein
MILGDHVDPFAVCRHTPEQTYTRQPCSCGRTLWPPRGRGRGESLTSPRRIAARLRELQAIDLHIAGYSYAEIARQLGYRDHSGPAHAVQRLRKREAAWERFEHDTGRRPYHRHQPTPYDLERAAEALREEWATGGLDGKRLEAATEELRRLIAGTRPRWEAERTRAQAQWDADMERLRAPASGDEHAVIR